MRKCSFLRIAPSRFREVLEQEAPGADVHDSALYRVPFLSGFPPLLANPAVAALRGAIDEFVESIAARSTRGAFTGGGASIAQFGHVQSAVAQAEAAVDAAQLILQRDLQQITEWVDGGVKLSKEQRIDATARPRIRGAPVRRRHQRTVRRRRRNGHPVGQRHPACLARYQCRCAPHQRQLARGVHDVRADAARPAAARPVLKGGCNDPIPESWGASNST